MRKKLLLGNFQWVNRLTTGESPDDKLTTTWFPFKGTQRLLCIVSHGVPINVHEEPSTHPPPFLWLLLLASISCM